MSAAERGALSKIIGPESLEPCVTRACQTDISRGTRSRLCAAIGLLLPEFPEGQRRRLQVLRDRLHFANAPPHVRETWGQLHRFRGERRTPAFSSSTMVLGSITAMDIPALPEHAAAPLLYSSRADASRGIGHGEGASPEQSPRNASPSSVVRPEPKQDGDKTSPCASKKRKVADSDEQTARKRPKPMDTTPSKTSSSNDHRRKRKSTRSRSRQIGRAHV